MSDHLPHYNYQVHWSEEDGSYIATVDEFPSLSYAATQPHDALYGLAGILVATIAELESSGERVPAPNQPSPSV